jgi:hypothetical protein
MKTQAIELMGFEYVLMLGLWWGVAVVLTLLFLAVKRSVVRWHARQPGARRDALPVTGPVER